jgi:hypothetical protein
LVLRRAGVDGKVGTDDDQVVRVTSPWAIGNRPWVVTDAQRVVLLTDGLPVNWLIQWTPGPDGVWGTADDTFDRSHPTSAPISMPTLSAGLLSFLLAKDSVVLDLSTLRWETAPGPTASTLSVNGSPLWTGGQGTVFYTTGGDLYGTTPVTLVARGPDGREASVPAGQAYVEAWGTDVAADATQMVAVSPDKGRLILYRPDSSGHFLTASAPTPITLLSTTSTIDHVALGGGKVLTLLRDASSLPHFYIFDGGAGGLASSPSPIEPIKGFNYTNTGAITATQAFIPTPSGIALYGAGPDGRFGTDDDTGGPTNFEYLLHATGAANDEAGFINYASFYKVDGRLMVFFDPVGGLSLLDAGPDGRFNTADDRERQLLKSWPTIFQGNFAVAGGRVGYITSGPTGSQVYLVDGFDGIPYQLTEHYSIKRDLALDANGTAYWADNIFAPEGIMRRAP